MSDFAIETDNLTKCFGDVVAVNNVSLRVKQGEIYGFLGLNGAGKTTTIRALLGMIRPSEGNVKVLGQALGQGGRGPWARVGHLVESPSAYPELSVHENLDVGDLFPWSIPALFSGAVGPRAEQLGFYSYVIVILASIIGLAATFYWWRNADQTR